VASKKWMPGMKPGMTTVFAAAIFGEISFKNNSIYNAIIPNLATFSLYLRFHPVR